MRFARICLRMGGTRAEFFVTRNYQFLSTRFVNLDLVNSR